MTHPPKYAQQYFVKDNCLFESGNNKQGAYTKKLCNFAPGAIREIMKDDGVSFERFVQLGGIHQSGRQLPEITIPAGDVEGLGWIVKYWGMDCILEPGLKTKASVWNAIQSTALDMERITAFSTTGWRHVDGNWRYLLPGDEQYTVELPGKMHGYGMERSYHPLDIQTAASLLWQSLAPEEIMLPLLSFTFLSPLNHFLKAAGCEPKFVMLLSGKTGSRKSTLAALMLSSFGKFTASELPLSFRDTANSILLNTFSLKDVLTVIDDLHPSSRMEEPKMNGTAQAIMRAYGDRTGKGRLRADSTPMESRPPQGNAIITAEFAPDIGESGTARYFALELKEKDVDLETLTAFQQEADDGTLQRCMFAYTEWIRESFLFSEESVQNFQKYLRTRFLFYRDQFRKDTIQCHGRVPETVAQLEIGMEFFLRFLHERGGFADEWCRGIFERFQTILTRLAKKQSDSIDEDKPTHMFIHKLFSLLESEKACLLKKNEIHDFVPQHCIGYEDEQGLGFLPQYAEENRLSSQMPAVQPQLQAKLAGQDADLSPVSQSQVNHYLFPFRGREPPQGLDTKFCPCGSGVGTHTGPAKGKWPLVGEEKHGYRRNFPDKGKWSVVHVALTTWLASRSASRRPQENRAEARTHFHFYQDWRNVMKNKKLSIRISDADWQRFHEKAEQANMTLTEYITDCCLGKQIVVIDGLDEVIRQQKAIGRNLNQLTTLANMGRVKAVYLQELTEAYTSVSSLLSDILKRKRW